MYISQTEDRLVKERKCLDYYMRQYDNSQLSILQNYLCPHDILAVSDEMTCANGTCGICHLTPCVNEFDNTMSVEENMDRKMVSQASDLQSFITASPQIIQRIDADIEREKSVMAAAQVLIDQSRFSKSELSQSCKESEARIVQLEKNKDEHKKLLSHKTSILEFIQRYICVHPKDKLVYGKGGIYYQDHEEFYSIYDKCTVCGEYIMVHDCCLRNCKIDHNTYK
jgi:hypothetical protein